MENRRRISSETERPFNRKSKFQNRSSEKAYGENKYQSKGNKFRARYEGEVIDQSSNSRGGKFQPRGGNFQRRDVGFQRGDGRFQNKNDRIQDRDDRFPKTTFDTKNRFPQKGKSVNRASWKKNPLPKITSEMQVTDGKHRGKFLTSSASPKIRPTTRRLREIMFRLIIRRVRARRFLDICAGSGAVGIEAISRGALLGTFVERSAKMCSFIRKNLAALDIKEGHGEVFESEAIPFLKNMERRKRVWDVVFLDPPYDADYDEILEYFQRGVCVKRRGVFIIEHHAEMFFPEKLGVLKRWRVIVEGESALSFYERL